MANSFEYIYFFDVILEIRSFLNKKRTTKIELQFVIVGGNSIGI